jgi:hypothetical protein
MSLSFDFPGWHIPPEPPTAPKKQSTPDLDWEHDLDVSTAPSETHWHNVGLEKQHRSYMHLDPL